MHAIDLSGRRARVTDAHSGLDRVIAQNFAAAGACAAAHPTSVQAGNIAGTTQAQDGGMLIYPDLSHRG